MPITVTVSTDFLHIFVVHERFCLKLTNGHERIAGISLSVDYSIACCVQDLTAVGSGCTVGKGPQMSKRVGGHP